MKSNWKKLWFSVAVAGSIFGISLLGYSQDGKQCPGGPGSGPMMGGHEGDRIIMMKDKLGLTDDQVTKLKAIFEASKTNIKPLMEKTKADMDILKEKVKTGAGDNDLKPLLDALEADHQKAMDARKVMMDQVKAVLTPTQQAKAAIAMSERMGDWKGKGPGKHRGGPDKDGDHVKDAK